MHTCDGVTNIINITGQAPAVNIHANYPKSYAEPGCKLFFQCSFFRVLGARTLSCVVDLKENNHSFEQISVMVY